MLPPIKKIVGDLEQLFTQGDGQNQIINIRTKIQEIISRSKCLPHVICMDGTREEIVVLFLILHLIKQQLVQVEQTGHFAENNCKTGSREYNNGEESE